MRARSALALLLLLASCGPELIERPSSSGRRAPRSRFYRFRVTAASVPSEIRHDLDREQISRLPGASRHFKTQGMTIIKHGLATHTRFSTSTGDTAVSAWFDDVILEVAISSITVYIPSEYPVGSCEYNAVLSHEKGHGRAARTLAVTFARRLESALAQAEGLATRSSPLIATDFAAAAEALKASIAQVVGPVYDQYEKEEAAGQAALDTPDPYDAVYKKCAGWK